MSDVFDVLDTTIDVTEEDAVADTSDMTEEEYQAQLAAEQEALRSRSVCIVHDSIGERYVDVSTMTGNVNILRVVGAADLRTDEHTEYYVNNLPVTAQTEVSAGATIWVVGKLSGGAVR